MNDKKHILVTGGAGFIGSNFIDYFLDKHKNIIIINLEKLTCIGELIQINYNYIFVFI